MFLNNMRRSIDIDRGKEVDQIKVLSSVELCIVSAMNNCIGEDMPVFQSFSLY